MAIDYPIIAPELRGEACIYDACKYFTLFARTPFRDKCAVVTSYNPQTRDITTEDTGASTETDKEFIHSTYTDLLAPITATAGKTKTETYEDWAKGLFKREPANMRLLIVVDKLLTGFDAPSCTYLYIDKSMADHGLFQAICRTNRLDGPDKDFGYIVDYKDLFKRVEKAIKVYSSELDHSAGGSSPDVLLKDRLALGRERLDNAIEALGALCEPVAPPKGDLEHLHYFCGNSEIASDLAEREPQRVALYKHTVALIRAFANIADELEAAGYTAAEISAIKRQRDSYLRLREMVRHASNETIDLKVYEADMRHLLDTYIEASQPRTISPFDGLSLLEIIVKAGIADAVDELPDGIRGNKEAVAETIENNVRSKIIKESLNDPAFFATMSALLDEIIATRKARAIDYEQYLRQIAELAKRVQGGVDPDTPTAISTPGLRALYNNLGADETLAIQVHAAVIAARPNSWRGNQPKEQVIRQALFNVLRDKDEVERIFVIIRNQSEF